MNRFAACVATLVLAASGFSQNRHPLQFADVLEMKRVGDPALSPDGQWVAYTVTVTLKDRNTSTSDVWISPVAGGAAKQMTRNEARDSEACWSPDGKTLAFTSTRDGASQIWLIPVDGGEARRLTTLSTGASGPLFSPDGKNVLFVSTVYPGCKTDEENRKKSEDIARNKVKAKVIDRLLYRHWNEWQDGQRSHLFVQPVDGGPAHDLTPGDHDVPPFSLGAPTAYAVSPDGKEVCFERNTDKVEATSTNTNLWTVPIEGGEAKLLVDDPGADGGPLYSPDGTMIAYRSQARGGYESDRWKLKVLDRKTGEKRVLSEKLDNWVEEYAFSHDSKSMLVAVDEQARTRVYAVSTAGDGGEPKRVLADGSNAGIGVAPNGTLVFAHQDGKRPTEIFRANADGTGMAAITDVNGPIFANLQLSEVEDHWFQGGGGAKIHGLMVKPPGFDATKKYPMVLFIHGGPQGAWAHAFSFRWNPQLLAGHGYVCFAVNPHGSTGYGQAFTEEISGDWGGLVYEDLMKGVDYAAGLGFVDKERLGAMGGSYGGYMANWILGHTDRFKALVSHAGLFNLYSFYGATEELWFPEFDLRGPFWKQREIYEKWSPHNFVLNFKTPTLVIHGELDYRVPIGEGLQLFTALQRQGVPSRLLYYPDEGHWILKPLNAKLWYEQVFDWLDTYVLGKGAKTAADGH